MNLIRKLACTALFAAAGLPAAQAAPAAARPDLPFVRLVPAQGERVRGGAGPLRIAAQLRGGQRIEPGSVVLRVDGMNVTRHLQVKGADIEYVTYLGVGPHTAELVLRDRGGRESRASWQFEIARSYWAWPFGEEEDMEDDFEEDGFWGKW